MKDQQHVKQSPAGESGGGGAVAAPAPKRVDGTLNFEGTKAVFSLKVDGDQDGKPVAEVDIKIDVAELPSEVQALLKK